MAPHDLKDHDPLVRFGGGVEPVQRIDDGGDRAVEAEGHRRGAKVVVDGFRNPDDGPACAEKLEAGGQRSIAADDDEGGDLHAIHRGFRAGYDFLGNLCDIAGSDLGGEMPLVGGAEDGAAELEDADGIGWLEDAEITGRQESLEAVLESDDLPAELVRRADDAMDDRIESGAIAAAVQDADSHETINFKL